MTMADAAVATEPASQTERTPSGGKVPLARKDSLLNSAAPDFVPCKLRCSTDRTVSELEEGGHCLSESRCLDGLHRVSMPNVHAWSIRSTCILLAWRSVSPCKCSDDRNIASCAVTFSPANGICTPSSTSCWYWDGLQWHVSPHLGKESSGGSSWSSPVWHLTSVENAARLTFTQAL